MRLTARWRVACTRAMAGNARDAPRLSAYRAAASATSPLRTIRTSDITFSTKTRQQDMQHGEATNRLGILPTSDCLCCFYPYRRLEGLLLPTFS